MGHDVHNRQPKKSQRVAPAVLSEKDVYKGLLGRGATWWHDGHREECEANGLPLRDAVLGGRPAAAVMQWFADRGAVDLPQASTSSSGPGPDADADRPSA